MQLKQCVWVLLLLLVASVTLNLLYSHSDQQQTQSRPVSNSRKRLRAGNGNTALASASNGVSNDAIAAFSARTAFCSIAVGSEPRQFSLNLLKSLAQNARSGYDIVVVLTDDVDYYATANYGLHLAEVTFIDVAKLSFPLPTVQRPKVDGKQMSERRAHKLSIKWLKTQLFRYAIC